MIVDIGDIPDAFKRAHSALIDRRGMPYANDHPEVLMQWWQEEYRAKILPDTSWSRWGQLEFESEEDYTMFLLRWS